MKESEVVRRLDALEKRVKDLERKKTPPVKKPTKKTGGKK